MNINEKKITKKAFQNKNDKFIIQCLNEYKLEDKFLQRAILSTSDWCSIGLFNMFNDLPNFDIKFNDNQFLTHTILSGNYILSKYIIENKIMSSTGEKFKPLIFCVVNKNEKFLNLLLKEKENRIFFLSKKMNSHAINFNGIKDFYLKHKNTIEQKYKIINF